MKNEKYKGFTNQPTFTFYRWLSDNDNFINILSAVKFNYEGDTKEQVLELYYHLRAFVEEGMQLFSYGMYYDLLWQIHETVNYYEIAEFMLKE